MQFDVYLFDFDGTICDSRESLLPVFQAGYALVGRPVTAEEVSVWMHVSLADSLVMSGIPKEQYQTVCDGIIAALDMPESIAMIKPFPEAFETMKRLAETGKKVGIVSNNTAKHICLVLAQLGYDGPLDCVVGSDMFKRGKPYPDPILLALEILGIPASKRACYIGDSLQDPETGHNAEIEGILVDRTGEHADFEGIKISSLDELLD